MQPDLLVALSAVFVGLAVTAGLVSQTVLARRSPARRRLDELMIVADPEAALTTSSLVDAPGRVVERIAAAVPKSPKELSMLRRRLTIAGYRSMDAAIVFSAAKIATPILFGVVVLLIAGPTKFVIAILGMFVGFLVPDFWLKHRTKARQKVIRNGLPDALDLFIVCLEAGSSLDQAIVKGSEELDIAYPALAEELRLITTEVRAGKPRLEAFKNFAERTRVDDVRALVAMLVQTDRFGTSVAQALRTHAEVSRTKRRQAAEEKAAKLSVKLVIPLVLFLFPAMYVVVLGPAVIKIAHVFAERLVR
jgi:tight adherence protein C